MSNQQLVSIIIPAFNAEKYIADTIESALAQTYQNHEIIVVDDGSDDDTALVVKRFPQVVLIQQSNAGVGAARNTALKHARGEVIALLDADDIWLPKKLSAQFKYWADHPELEIIFSLAQNITTYLPGAPITSKFPILEAPVPSTSIFRSELLSKIGYFDSNVKVGEFADWYGKIINAKIKKGCVPELLVFRRIHGENIGIRKKNLQVEYVRVLKRKLDQAKKLNDSFVP